VAKGILSQIVLRLTHLAVLFSFYSFTSWDVNGVIEQVNTTVTHLVHIAEVSGSSVGYGVCNCGRCCMLSVSHFRRKAVSEFNLGHDHIL